MKGLGKDHGTQSTGKRQQDVRDRFEFVVFDGEYSGVHAILAGIDAFYTGGIIMTNVVESDLKDFFGDVAQKMMAKGLDPTTEPIYVDYFIFNNWQDLPFNNKLPLPNKFVPYVAARKKGRPEFRLTGQFVKARCTSSAAMSTSGSILRRIKRIAVTRKRSLRAGRVCGLGTLMQLYVGREGW